MFKIDAITLIFLINVEYRIDTIVRVQRPSPYTCHEPLEVYDADAASGGAWILQRFRLSACIVGVAS
jgi:hypothetical protein